LPGLLGVFADAPDAWRAANLPTHERGGVLQWRYWAWNNSPHMAGTKAFFAEDKDQAWNCTFVTNMGGTFAVFDPQGRIVATKKFDEHVKWTKLEVPADGKTGTYTLMCVEPTEFILTNKNPEYQPHARVVSHTLPMVVQVAGQSQDTPVTGRRLCFALDPAASGGGGGGEHKVYVGSLDERRHARVYQPLSHWETTTKGVIPNAGRFFYLTIPSELKDQPLALEFPLEPDEYYLPPYNRARYLQFTGIFPFVAASPKDVFVPQVPKEFEPYKGTK
jgi:hypothetical protein